MPKRKFSERIPPAILAKLDRRIIAAGYGDYRAHAAWLKAEGYPISKSALHLYGRALQTQMELDVAARTATFAEEAHNLVRYLLRSGWKPPRMKKPRGSLQPARLPDHRPTKL